MTDSSLFKKASSFFNKGKTANQELSDNSEEDIEVGNKKPQGDTRSYWNPTKIAEIIGNKANSVQETAQNLQLGMAFMLGAGVVLFLSSLYLPVIALFPHKFCTLFSIGSLLMMFSISIMVGHQTFLKKLFTMPLLPYSLAYFGSILVGLYYSSIKKSYLMALLMIVAQAVSLAYLVFVNIPFGRSTLNMAFKGILSSIKWVCSSLFGKRNETTSFLPI